MTRRRVVVTGLGTVNPLGVGVPGFWHGLVNGHNGIGPINLFDAAAFKVRIAGLLKRVNRKAECLNVTA